VSDTALKHRVLVVNDDGIHSSGIALLERLARTLTDDVWVVAPEFENSGAGHSLSLADPIRIRQLDDKKYVVRGTPTDCVVLACNHIIKDACPTLVLSGVNRGGNLAEDVTYSGTIAGAMEGTLLGIPSLCMSQVFRHRDDLKWQTAEHFGAELLARLVETGWPKEVFINVNFPPIDPEEVRGTRVTRQGQRSESSIRLDDRVDARGFPYFWLSLKHEVNVYPPDTDLAAIDDGWISVTPLQLDMTHSASLTPIREALVRFAPPKALVS
jgi:5'-nucleotidase